MKIRNLLTTFIVLFFIQFVLSFKANSQNIGINSTGATPNSSAMLDIDVSAMATKKGLLIPRITAAEKTAMNPLPAVAQGLIIYQTDGVQGFYYNTSTTTTPSWSYLYNSNSNNIWTKSGTNVTLSNSVDYIGLGTTNPEEKLHVENGNMLFGNNVAIRGRTSLSFTSSANVLRVFSDEILIGSNVSNETFRAIKLYIPEANWGPSDGSFEIFKPGASTPVMHINENGNIGINTNSPEEQFHLETGNILFGNDVALRGRTNLSFTSSANVLRVFSDEILIGSNVTNETFRAIKLYIPEANWGPSDGNFEIFKPGVWTPVMHINENGNIGVNTNSPEEQFHLETGNMLFGNDVALRGRTNLSFTSSANVLRVFSDEIIIGSNVTNETFRAIKLYIPEANWGPSDGNFEIFKPGAWTPVMHINENGNIGINTSSPNASLDIVGTFRLSNGAEGSGKVLTSDASGNASWQEPSAATTTAWGLTGNSGTTDGINFIGTTDNVALNFKVKNLKAGRIFDNQTILGVNAASNNSAPNIAFGNSSLQSNTYAGYNIAIGDWALSSQAFNNSNSVYYSYNLAIGTNALTNNQPTSTTNGYLNSAIGHQALYHNTTGSMNTAISHGSLFNNVFGNNNISIGTYSMYNNTCAGNNISIGNYALYTQSYSNLGSTYSTANVAIGYYSLYSNNPTSTNNGNFNTAIGTYSLLANQQGLENTATGYCSLRFLTNGQYNTASGSNALRFNITGNNNTAIGASSGINSLGSNNIFIGYNAASNLNSGDKNIIIGSNIDVPVSPISNFLNIGNIIFGTSINGTGTTISSGNIGIGTVSPAAKLEVFNSSGASLTEIQINSNGITDADFILKTTNTNMGWFGGGSTNKLAAWNYANNTEPLTILGANGYVGIGATSPSEKLTVTGAETTAHGKNAAIGIINTSAPGTGWYLRAGAAGTVTPTGGFSIADNSAYRFCIDNTGNIGIGTTTPTELLHVTKSADVTKSVVYSYSTQLATNIDYQNRAIVGIAKGGNSSWGYAFGVSGVADQANSFYATGVYAGLGSAAPSTIGSDQALYANGAGIGNSGIFMNGNVGIGTSAPAYQLQLSLDQAAKPSTNTWTIASDERLKKDITSFTDGLNVILQINPVKYKYNGKAGMPTDQENIGILAQEIQKVAPYTVGIFKYNESNTTERNSPKNETEYLSFNSHALTFVTINAIKEQQKQIEELQKTVEMQQKQIEQLLNK